jgi:hypothetical protein
MKTVRVVAAGERRASGFLSQRFLGTFAGELKCGGIFLVLCWQHSFDVWYRFVSSVDVECYQYLGPRVTGALY